MSLATTVILGNFEGFWIGMDRNDAGGMEWVDGSPTTYFNWAPNSRVMNKLIDIALLILSTILFH